MTANDLDLATVEKLESIFDQRYVRVDDCTEKQTEVNRKFAKDDKRIDKLVDKFNTWDKLLWVIASAGIGALVLEFFGLVLK